MAERAKDGYTQSAKSGGSGGGGWLQRRARMLRSRARTDAGLDRGPAFQNDAATLAFVHPALVVNDVAGFCEGLRRRNAHSFNYRPVATRNSETLPSYDAKGPDLLGTSIYAPSKT